MPAYNSGSATFGSLVSGDYRIAALEGSFLNGAPQIWSAPWMGTNITYSFPTGTALWDGGQNYGKGEISAGWLPMSAAQQGAVRQALDAWSAVSAVKFTEVPDGANVGDLRFGFTSAITGTTLGWGYYPVSDNARAGDVWINASLAGKAFGPSVNKPFGTYSKESANGYFVLMHEIGHALGLSHPFHETGETRGTEVLPTLEDNQNNTIMSYTSAEGPYGGIPSTPMPYDILAIQLFYGRDFSHNTGNTAYTYDINDINLLTIWDAGGEDTIVVTNNSNLTRATAGNSPLGVLIDLREGAGSSIGFSSQYWAGSYPDWRSNAATKNIFIAYNCVIENAVGTSSFDNIIGNPANNKITGGLGGDAIDGGAGIDTSIYSGNRSSYTVAKTGTGFTVKDTDTDTLTNIERLKFSDVSVALDLAGNAGTTAKLLGAVFGKAEVANKAYVGIGLGLLDGGMSYQALTQAALDVRLGAGASHTALVNLLFQNLMSRAPSTDELNMFTGLLANGTYSPASLGVVAADTTFNTDNINLVGLTNSGIEYL